METATYELVNSRGHGGPYFSKDEAIRRAAAQLRGSASEARVYIKDRATNKTVVTVKKVEGDEGDVVICLDGDSRAMDTLGPGDQFYHDAVRYLAVRTVQVGVLKVNAIRMWDGEFTEVPGSEMVNRVALAND